MHTPSIPLQPIHPSTQTLDAYVDQYLTIVDSRYNIPSFSLDSSPTNTQTERPSEDSTLSSDGELENNNNNDGTTPNMMRKAYYDPVLENDDDQDLHHNSYKEQEDEEQERLVNDMDDLNSHDGSSNDKTPKVYSTSL